MVGQEIALERVGIVADVPIEAERQERAIIVPGQHPVKVVRAVGQVVAEQDGGESFGVWHVLENRWGSGVAAGHVERR